MHCDCRPIFGESVNPCTLLRVELGQVMVLSSPKLLPGAHPDQVPYDLTHNPGYLAMGTPADTTEFAVDAITSTKKQRITASGHWYQFLEVLSSPRRNEILDIVF